MSIDVAIYVVARDEEDEFRCVAMNPASERMLGVPELVAVGRKISSLNSEFESLVGTQNRYQSCLEAGEPVELEIPFAPEEVMHWWMVRLTPIDPRHGERRHIIVTAFPITARKQAEEALKGSERRFKALFNSTFQFSGLLKPDGTMIEANQTALEFGGLTSQDVIGKPFWDCYWWQSSSQARDELKRAVAIAASGMFVRYNAEILGRNAAVCTIDFSIKPVRDESGKVILLIPEGRDITESIRTRKAEREQFAFLQALLDSVADGIVACDEMGRLTLFNRTARDFHGLSEDQDVCDTDGFHQWSDTYNLYRTDGQLMPEEEIPLVRAYKGETVREAEMAIAPVNGKTRTLLATGQPIVDEKGHQLGAVVAMHDVTEQKRIEEALRRSEALLSSILNSSLDGVMAFRAVRDDKGAIHDFEVLLANPTAGQIMGAPVESIVGKRLLQQMPAIRSTDLPERFTRVVESGEALKDQYLYYSAGRQVWLSYTAVRLHDGFAITFRDITERKERERALQASQELLSGLMESSLDGIVALRSVRDTSGAIEDFEWLLVNASAGRILGRTPEELIGRRLMETLPGNKELGLFEQYAQVVETGEPLSNEFHYGRDGLSGWFQSTAVKLGDGFAVTFRNVTGNKEAEIDLLHTNAVLEQRNRELQEFAYVASHDLQEPLRKVRAFSDLLRTEFGDRLDGNGTYYLERMDDAATRMSRLITDLLVFSRIISRAQPFQDVELGRILDTVLSDLSMSISAAEAVIDVGTLPRIEVEPTQMYQLFQNLVGNAVKFVRPGITPNVRISAELADGVDGMPTRKACRITVADNGIGFEEKYLDRIFTPFQRLHSRSEYPGTGIGLAICRRIIEYHHGSITARSVPGEGSTFIVTLPVRQRQK